MLGLMRQTLPNLCWLRDSERRGISERIAIRPEKWSSKPSGLGPSFFSPNFDLTTVQPWLVGEPVAWPTEFAGKTGLIHREEPQEAVFTEWHREILNGIAAGQFKKVVPWAEEKLEFEQNLSWRHFAEAFASFPNRYNYGFQFGEEGLCGVTPEILFRVENDQLETMALAGTAAVGGTSLLEDRKEQLEHQVVIDHLVEVLAKVGAVQVGSTDEVSFGMLKHLRTPVRVTLRQTPDFTDLVHRLHPTAALGGWPRSEALRSLRSRSGARGRFGAPFGFVDGERMMCVVAIRGLQWRGRHARLMSGCGVVEGSLAEREWRELALKRRSVAEMLGLSL